MGVFCEKNFLASFLVLFSLSTRADFITAEKDFNDRRYQEAFNEFLSLSETGDFRVQYYLGHMYLTGLGVTKDEKKALEYIQKSADQGYDKAETLLGFLYDEGRLVPQDKKKAVSYYKKAADMGNTFALLNLGVAYYKGEGVAKNDQLAIEMLEKVPLDQQPLAGRYLGEIYLSNPGFQNHYQKAESAYSSSAKNGDIGSFFALGRIYSNPESGLINGKRAVSFYAYAASQGYPPAQYRLGMSYVNGEGVERDLVQGHAWLEMAAIQNYEPAISALAQLDEDMTIRESESARNEFNRIQREVIGNLESPFVIEEQKRLEIENEHVGCGRHCRRKPIIYLYPEEITDVTVALGYPENATHTYPKYNEPWKVQAEPSGDLTDLKTGRHYYALYWEGKNTVSVPNPKEGFVVAGKDTISFLEEKLDQLGLTEREAEEFIVYWLPKLESAKYNLIRFQTLAEQNKNMPLNITPAPKTLIRVMMEYKNLDKPIQVKEQVLPSKPQRNGFTVVEWGGTEI